MCECALLKLSHGCVVNSGNLSHGIEPFTYPALTLSSLCSTASSYLLVPRGIYPGTYKGSLTVDGVAQDPRTAVVSLGIADPSGAVPSPSVLPSSTPLSGG